MNRNLSTSMILLNNTYVKVLYLNVCTTATVSASTTVRASPLDRVLSPLNRVPRLHSLCRFTSIAVKLVNFLLSLRPNPVEYSY